MWILVLTEYACIIHVEIGLRKPERVIRRGMLDAFGYKYRDALARVLFESHILYGSLCALRNRDFDEYHSIVLRTIL